ncbi:hypothetical protein B0T16DRAFT_413631 [Cercophora newfieldiana]|uniref:Uncharacterized protein n=1 Tax=Cercophora newfieldiana TaxID=92897 RepID=A0AA39Y5P2_9PEZI|nr:hypothetical protein B0T16DRAFT_413631 [Cercophora newfieldiana]
MIIPSTSPPTAATFQCPPLPDMTATQTKLSTHTRSVPPPPLSPPQTQTAATDMTNTNGSHDTARAVTPPSGLTPGSIPVIRTNQPNLPEEQPDRHTQKKPG